MHFAVPLVPMWCHTRGVGKYGNQCNGASRDFGTSSSNIPDQNHDRQICIRIDRLHCSVLAFSAMKIVQSAIEEDKKAIDSNRGKLSVILFFMVYVSMLQSRS